MRILYLTAEPWPTHRADLVTLFGKYLPRFNIDSDLVTEQDLKTKLLPDWAAGKAILCQVPTNRALQYLFKFVHQLKVLVFTDFKQYEAIQVRDVTFIALIAIIVCKLKRKPLFYWLSYPQSEGQVQRAKARGVKAGIRFWFPLIQGKLGEFFLYKFILPNVEHVFVQSQNMLEALSVKSVEIGKMTPVPMGVDLESVVKTTDVLTYSMFENKRIIVYLGTMDPIRKIEILIEMVAIIKNKYPNILLLLVGDTDDLSHREWLKKEANRLNVSDQIYWTGWLPMQEAWQYVNNAEVGLSPIPRSYLLDMGSPTKAVEYMALGIPVVMNDNPDQAQVVKQSCSGLCVPLTPESFANATMQLLDNTELREQMARKGRNYIKEVRGYDQIAYSLASKYHDLISKLS